MRQGFPFSMRSIVRGESPAIRASSALLNILASRIFLTLFSSMRSDLFRRDARSRQTAIFDHTIQIDKLIVIIINYGGLGALRKQDLCHSRGRQRTVDFSTRSAALESNGAQNFRLIQPILTILNNVRSERQIVDCF